MSESAIAPGPVSLSGVMRIALFEAAESDARASFAAWPGDRVETNALLMPSGPASVSAAAHEPAGVIDQALVVKPASEPLVSFAALAAALLAVVVLTAAGGVVSAMIALVLFR